jgi:hypothetical protein
MTLRAKKWRKVCDMSWNALPPCSCGSWMLSPTLEEGPANAPLFTASMIPGPPPEITENPASDRRRPMSSATA